MTTLISRLSWKTTRIPVLPLLFPFPCCCSMVRAIHYKLMNWLKLMDVDVLQGNTNVVSLSRNVSGNSLPKWKMQRDWGICYSMILSVSLTGMPSAQRLSQLRVPILPWEHRACSHHLHFPCSSDMLCSCCHCHLNTWHRSLASRLWWSCCTKRPCCGCKHYRLHQKTTEYNSSRLLYENLDFHP